MRAYGSVNDISQAGAADHVCWVYDDDASFDTAVRDFLAGGLARGERLLCVGERVIDGLRADSANLGGVDRLVAEGALQTLTLAEAYASTGRFLPERQRAFYEAATRRALEDGYRGLRVVAEVSAIAGDPEQRAQLLCWEHIADDFVTNGPGMSAMCAYRGDLCPDALDDVASVHPLVHLAQGLPPFQVFFDEQRIALTGSVDSSGAERLAGVLAASPVTGPVVTLDLGFLEFIGVAGCRTLARWVQELSDRSIRVEFRGASRLVQRMWELLGFSEVAAVTFLPGRS